MKARDLPEMSSINLHHYWMPFTDNRRFKARPRLIASAKDMYYTTVEGKQVLDGLATLWCVNAGHGRPRIVEAIRKQAGELDFASSFSLGHPLPFRLAERIAKLTPRGMERVFFTKSGSEAIDTALKIAIAYHRLRGEGTRTRFIGRERSYHGILLVLDEVITGWGRVGTPFASQHFGVQPDLITFAKGITSGAVPLGGVIVSNAIYDTFMNANGPGIEFFHGYTYSGHPLACAAGLAALETYEEEALFKKAAGPLGRYFEDGVHSLKGLPHVVDCRNLGLIGAVELASRPNAYGARAME